ncbi:MAG: FAD:protein FMN transferase [Oscillospiraceae bacterium]|jgi:thiamine biosynthesis lipoprotein|nr:FAD:protein FMN transferase [Oscillospiraceae bacterium]
MGQRRSKRTRRAACVALAVVLAAATAGCGPAARTPVSATWDDLFGTVITVSLHDAMDEGEADAVLAAVRARGEAVQNAMTAHTPGSEIGAVRAASGRAPVPVSEDTYGLLTLALEVAALSGGAFDPTVEPLVALWGIGTGAAAVPAEADIARVLKLVDYRRVVLDGTDRTVYLPEAGMGLDLGGIAKGYAADEANRLLDEAGVTHAILDFGGNVLLRGGHPEGKPWRVGIRKPVPGEDGYACVLSLRDGTVVTSGGYERYFVAEDGAVYHHIMDPATGRPAETGLLSATIICDNSARADALSTACFVLGLDGALALLGALDGVEGVLIASDRTIHTTPGLADVFTVADESYVWVNAP